MSPGSIPKELAKLTVLRVLRLGANRLSGEFSLHVQSNQPQPQQQHPLSNTGMYMSEVSYSTAVVLDYPTPTLLLHDSHVLSTSVSRLFSRCVASCRAAPCVCCAICAGERCLCMLWGAVMLYGCCVMCCAVLCCALVRLLWCCCAFVLYLAVLYFVRLCGVVFLGCFLCFMLLYCVFVPFCVGLFSRCFFVFCVIMLFLAGLYVVMLRCVGLAAYRRDSPQPG